MLERPWEARLAQAEVAAVPSSEEAYRRPMEVLEAEVVVAAAVESHPLWAVEA